MTHRFSLFYDPAMESYYRGQRFLLEQQAEKQRLLNQQKQKHGRSKTRQRTLKIKPADRGVVTIFTALQTVWRRQGTLRRTYDGMRSSPEERSAWKHLIEYLLKDNNARP
jgi:hypothetical protein